MKNKTSIKAVARKGTFGRKFKRYWPLYAILAVPLASLIIFSYLPMGGIIIAFKDYSPRLGIWASEFMHPLFAHFKEALGGADFLKVTWNTIRISLLRILFGFPAPIILALFLNEIRHNRFKKVIQTAVYLPYFLSWIVVAGIVRTMMSGDGMINSVIKSLGGTGIPFLTDPKWFLFTLVFSAIWKDTGYGSIIYMAAIAGIDPTLYEAATVDGANRWQKMRFITLPSLRMAISINLILTISGILSAGFDQVFNLYSAVVYDTADIIDTYVYRMGLVAGNFEVATALGLVKSLIGLSLIVVANKVSQKLGGEALW